MHRFLLATCLMLSMAPTFANTTLIERGLDAYRTGSADRAMQIFGGAGVCQDTMIPEAFTVARFCRIPDGPDEVHMSQLGKLTISDLVR